MAAPALSGSRDSKHHQCLSAPSDHAGTSYAKPYIAMRTGTVMSIRARQRTGASGNSARATIVTAVMVGSGASWRNRSENETVICANHVSEKGCSLRRTQWTTSSRRAKAVPMHQITLNASVRPATSARRPQNHGEGRVKSLVGRAKTPPPRRIFTRSKLKLNPDG